MCIPHVTRHSLLKHLLQKFGAFVLPNISFSVSDCPLVYFVVFQATLVRNLNEADAGILYEYLAEASQVFPQVFPIV